MPRVRRKGHQLRAELSDVGTMTNAEIAAEMDRLNAENAEKRGTRWMGSEAGWNAFFRFDDLLSEQRQPKTQNTGKGI